MTLFKRNPIDKVLMLCSLSYVILPIVLFAYGWLRPVWAFAIIVFLGAFCYICFRSLCKTECSLICKNTWKYWIAVVLILGIWVYMSGIGSFAFQNSDYWARNPIYRDLCDYNWPVIYDLSVEPEIVQTTAGTDKVMLSYYFSWWLVPAFISKALHLSHLGKNIVLYIYALIGVILIVYNICRYFDKTTYLIPTIFIFFSGMDAVGFWLKNNIFPSVEHIEWWSIYFQFTSNTSQLYWVFNQSIPIWVITILLLQLESNMIPAVASLSFAYSPWATIGILPIAVGSIFGRNKRIKNVITWQNIAIPILMFIVFGLFYAASSGFSNGSTGFIFTIYSGEKRNVLMSYILIVFLEVIAFFMAMGNTIRNEKYYYIVLIELVLYPLYRVAHYNFLIRGTIPALFILMIFCIRFLLQDDNAIKLRKNILILILCIGAITPITEIRRSMKNTIENKSIINEWVYSFGNIRTDDAGIIKALKNQYFTYDYDKSYYYKYISKHLKDEE